MQTRRIASPMLLLCLNLLCTSIAHADLRLSTAGGKQGMDFRITVYDADEKIPIGLARVVLQRGREVIAQDVTNTAGQMWFRDIQPGSYTLTAWFVGYQIFTDSILISEDHTSCTINLRPEGSQLEGVEVVGKRELGVSSIDLRTGNQTFESETYHPPPTAQMTNLIQQNAMGAARAPTSEVHIRGQHGEFTYYIDGIPIPLGVFGGLNEVVDPKVSTVNGNVNWRKRVLDGSKRLPPCER